MRDSDYDARSFAWLKNTCLTRADSKLLLPFTLTSEGTPRIHATWERGVHKFIVHLLLVLLPGYGLSRDNPAPIYRRYLQRNFRQGLETKRTESILLVGFCDDVRGRCGVKLWEYGSTVFMNLRALLICTYMRKNWAKEHEHNSYTPAS
jgi:hypothetical protein